MKSQTRLSVRSINQSNRSISVRLSFLFCSRAFISRSYENRSSVISIINEDHRSCIRNLCSCEKNSGLCKMRTLDLCDTGAARRGQGFESRSSLNIFFRISFCNCTSCVYNCDDLHSNNSSLLSSHNYMIFISGLSERFEVDS